MFTKQTLHGNAVEMMRRVPAAIGFLRDPPSRKDARKGPGYPGHYDWIERIGMAAGPLAYLGSRWAQRRCNATRIGDV